MSNKKKKKSMSGPLMAVLIIVLVIALRLESSPLYYEKLINKIVFNDFSFGSESNDLTQSFRTADQLVKRETQNAGTDTSALNQTIVEPKKEPQKEPQKEDTKTNPLSEPTPKQTKSNSTTANKNQDIPTQKTAVQHLPGQLEIKLLGENGSKTVTCQDCDYTVGVTFCSAYTPTPGYGCLLSAHGDFYCYVDGDFYPLILEADNKCYANGHYICDAENEHIMESDVTIFYRSDIIPFPDIPSLGITGSTNAPNHHSDKWQQAEASTKALCK